MAHAVPALRSSPPGPARPASAASPLSTTCIFGVFTRRFPTLRCQGRRRRTRKSLSSTAMYSRTVARSSPNSRDRPDVLSNSPFRAARKLQKAGYAVWRPRTFPTSRTSRSTMLWMYCRYHWRARAGFRASGSGYPPEASRWPRPPGVHQVSARAQDGRHRSRQQVAQEASGPTLLLRFGQGHESGDFHAPRQRLGDRGDQGAGWPTPSKTNRPGRRSRSTDSLIAGSSSGCTLDFRQS